MIRVKLIKSPLDACQPALAVALQRTPVDLARCQLSLGHMASVPYIYLI